MPINFRQLRAKDSISYRRVRSECLQNFPENFGSSFEEESKIHELKFERFLHEENSENFMFAAFDSENLIGICGFLHENRNKTKHRGEIVQMYVNSDFTGRKIGQHLLQKTIDKAFENPEIEQIILGVVADNQQAVKLYKKIGFVEYGLLKNYFKQGETYWHQRFMVLYR